ncbi:Pentatricopeptide repeat-containing protein [Nymphaea thermarum]|nr:Pentatricopeptide repeat-containing protein [Nymphaea thermarum]
MKVQKWALYRLLLKDPTSCALMLQGCARTRQLNKGKELHAHIITTAKQPSIFVSNHLINMYSKCGDMACALQVFDEMPQRNLVSWTAVISGLSQNGAFQEALRFLEEMRISRWQPSQFALSCAVQACAALGWVQHGKQLHSLTLKTGFGSELFVGSNLIDMYSKFGLLVDAQDVFNGMSAKDKVCWTALIDACSKNGEFSEALRAFRKMNLDGIPADQHVLCSALSACGGLNSLPTGKSLHASVIKYGFESDVVVGNSLIDMYSKSGDVESASLVFSLDSQMLNVVSCSTLIDGFAENDEIEKAVNIYLNLRRQGIVPNEFTFSSLLKACAGQAALEQGKQLHAQVIKAEFAADPFVSTVLIDMYGKSGLLESSLQVFHEIQDKTDIAYNAIIGVFAHHGYGREAIQHFEKMVSKGMKPNAITFVNLLTACSHAGLVDEGLSYFNSMSMRFNFTPRDEHCACVIDLLSRAGKLKEAEEFIKAMPSEPNAFAWCSLLGACRRHGDAEKGKLAAEKLMMLEPENNGTHVLLSNLYAAVGQWEDVKSVRKLIKETKVKKLPGYSWVDVNNKTHIFGAEDFSHPQKKEIYAKLESLSDRMREAGYIPYTGSVSSNVEECLKEKLLQYHSERIALAFALISIPSEKEIIKDRQKIVLQQDQHYPVPRAWKRSTTALNLSAFYKVELVHGMEA